MIYLAIDPGNEESAYLAFDGGICFFGKKPNEDVRALVKQFRNDSTTKSVTLVIERIASYGMAVGETVFETVYWSGRFAEAWGDEDYLLRIKRGEVKMHLCHSMRAKDANVRQALIDRFGGRGTKKEPGGTYGITNDVWAALAVAVTAYDRGLK